MNQSGRGWVQSILEFAQGVPHTGAFAEVSVASDKIVFPLGELTGNIWMTKLDLK